LGQKMLLPWMSERRSSWRERVVRRWCLPLTFSYYAGSRGRGRRTRRRRSAWRTPGSNKTKDTSPSRASMAPESVVLFSFLRREGRRGRAGGGREDGEGRRKGRGTGGRVGRMVTGMGRKGIVLTRPPRDKLRSRAHGGQPPKVTSHDGRVHAAPSNI